MNRIKQLTVHNFYANILCSRILEFRSTGTIIEQLKYICTYHTRLIRLLLSCYSTIDCAIIHSMCGV